MSKGDALPYIPEHQASLKLSVESRTTGVGLTVTYVDDMRDVAGRGGLAADELVPAHTVPDLSAFYRPSTQGRIYLTVDNLLAEDYMVSRRPFGARPGKPFHLNLGYTHWF